MTTLPSQIGPYTVTRELGRGGMGVVYLARDSRLDRAVAIKSLPPELATDPARLERFEREARTLAQLNHPNVAGIYGVEEADGHRYLVLEFVEGETLAQRLDRAPLPIDEAIELAAQIAVGVEAAHEKGVIHRDLKPGNVMVTPDGAAKVLDFGLARADPASAPSAGATDDSPTLTSPVIAHSPTMPGVILGTAGYMSPEQARGKPVDKRTDIFSFGCVLYEMLTGEQPFRGETVSDSIGAVLHKDVNLDRLPAQTPANVRRVLSRCLERDKAQRYRDIGDVLLDLRVAHEDDAHRRQAANATPPRRLLMVASMFLLGSVVLAAALWSRRVPPAHEPPGIKRFALSGFNMPIDPNSSVAISPDGARIAVRSREETGEPMLRVRSLESLESVTVPGSSGGILPFFSPDGQRLVFFVLGELKIAPIRGGDARPIATTSWSFTGGAWLDDDSIVFTGADSTSFFQVSPSGGPVQTIEPALPSDADRIASPSPLPGSRGVLCVVRRTGRFDVAVYSRQDNRVTILAQDGYQPVYAASGHVIYQSGQTGMLMALPFDPRGLVASGEPFALPFGVPVRGSYQMQTHAIAQDGTLALILVDWRQSDSELVRVDPTGSVELIHRVDRLIDLPRLSHDGRRIAYRAPGIDCKIWVYDRERGSAMRITAEGDHHGIVWSSDDQRIITFRRWQDQSAVASLRVDGVGGAVPISDPSPVGLYALGTTPDGREVLLTDSLEGAGYSMLRVLEIEQGRMRPAHEQAPQVLGGALSPDASLIAYTSIEPGRSEVYLQPYPSFDTRVQVSVGGGDQPAWSRDGGTLYYRQGRTIFAVEVSKDGALAVGRPERAFEFPMTEGPFGLTGYDIDDNGGLIAVRAAADGEASQNDIDVVLNVFTEINRLEQLRRR